MGLAHDRLRAGLGELDAAGLLRRRRLVASAQGRRLRVDGADLANFAGNDYLGLASDPRMVEVAREAIATWGVGSAASALVSGHMGPHEECERRFAAFAGVGRALLFGSGYLANLGILAALADRHAEIFSDRLNHACLIDGARLSRATLTRYPHLDTTALALQLEGSTAVTKVIATDTVFSMEGDVAPLTELARLAERHDAWLVLDDAHGFGVLGRDGRGALEHFGLASPRVVYMATLGKAMGGYGALVGGEATVIEWLLQRARTYVFSTAPPPMVAAVASAAMALLEADPAIVARLHERIALLKARCAMRGIELLPSPTAIQPVPVGDARAAVELSEALRVAGFLVPAIRPPTVPEGTSRLRISLSAAHSTSDVEGLVEALARALAARGG